MKITAIEIGKIAIPLKTPFITALRRVDVAMAMMQGLTSAIVNPNDLRLMETIKSCDIFKNNELYSDSYLEV